ncbi:HTH-type transcriptional regulator benR (Ben and cat operon transcriptional regulator) [Marinobacter nauticus ATCC 49840]|jgi:DNA-binding transcriptional LysR family regulator|uniref:LysR family transcriptional regulator n=1 Tax=Marinobacter nauticus TaxID=2743 RepID=UPI000256EB5F|nr:LysR family transcriptional regulator [Marinobacter nauticus]CCG93777.1 HTH-type transcriptional regulator benR (Ben and cat operon transcriptional regulator) [Marinobacter nauticus ATCC 49840]
MELRHLRYFVAVAEAGNLTRAAEKLFIAQPPLTRAIKQLEEEVGVELFIRKPRGLELTTGGEYFLEQAKQVLDKVNATVDDTRRIARHRKTLFSIGFVPSVFYGQLPLMVRRLRQNKNLEIVLHELKTREQVEALKTGKIDIGFGRLNIQDPDVEQELLFDEPMIAAVPANHPLTRHPPSMKELSEVPMITFPAGAGPNFSDITQGLFHRRGLRVNVIQQVNDVQTALSLVASDMGFTLVPEQVRRLQREGVDYMPLEDDNITTPVIASRRRGENPNAVMRLTNTILAELVENRLTGRYP